MYFKKGFINKITDCLRKYKYINKGKFWLSYKRASNLKFRAPYLVAYDGLRFLKREILDRRQSNRILTICPYRRE